VLAAAGASYVVTAGATVWRVPAIFILIFLIMS
jgi:hypothetical protein